MTERIRIDGRGELEQAVMGDPTMRAKMANVSRLLDADPTYRSNLTTERLVEFIEENPGYDIPLSVVDGEKALMFDPSPQHRHQIPQLLADDYLRSQLTDRQYEAGSKMRVGG